MAYEPYVTPEYYQMTYGGTIVPDEELARFLRQASRHIDSLTYNRIVGTSYSINGVSVQIGSTWNVLVEKGVAMMRETYAQLCQTGLCCRLAR